jgi:hypothetical protein
MQWSEFVTVPEAQLDELRSGIFHEGEDTAVDETSGDNHSTWSLSDENAHATQEEQFHDRVVGGLIRDYEQRIDVLREEREAQRQRADENEIEVSRLRSGMAQLRQLALRMEELHIAQQRQAENEARQGPQRPYERSPPLPSASSTTDEDYFTAYEGCNTDEEDQAVKRKLVKHGESAQLVPHPHALGLY